MKADSKMPSINLSTKRRTKESIQPERSVQVLHNTQTHPIITFLFTLSDNTPPKMPKVAYDAVKARPDSSPYQDARSGYAEVISYFVSPAASPVPLYPYAYARVYLCH